MIKPSLSPEQISRRNTQLERDYEAMQSLVREVPVITFTTRGRRMPPDCFKVEMKIRSITDVDKHCVPTYENLFRFDIELPARYPYQLPICKVSKDSPIPFHPHFSRRRLWAQVRWVDYERYDPTEGLASYVLRIAHSLRYDPHYINEFFAENETALRWYLNRKTRFPDTFPTNQIQLPDTSPDQNWIQPTQPSTGKKFQISESEHQPTSNRFSINDTTDSSDEDSPS